MRVRNGIEDINMIRRIAGDRARRKGFMIRR
jgi:hypothetical protein